MMCSQGQKTKQAEQKSQQEITRAHTTYEVETTRAKTSYEVGAFDAQVLSWSLSRRACTLFAAIRSSEHDATHGRACRRRLHSSGSRRSAHCTKLKSSRSVCWVSR